MDEESTKAFSAVAGSFGNELPDTDIVELHEFFIKLTDGGFTENQALKLLAYLAVRGRDD